MDDREKSQAVCRALRAIADSPVHGGDFEDVSVYRIERHFAQGPNKGVLITFSISWHALGKADGDKTRELLSLLPTDE